MSREEIIRFICCCWLLILVSSQSLEKEKDKEVLLDLRDHLLAKNRIRQGPYARWNKSDPSPCGWSGIACDDATGRVVRIDLRESNISGGIFANFSLLTALAHLDLSSNTIGGPIPDDLSRCSGLTYLNLSHNLIEGGVDLAALTNLITLDLTHNRFNGSIGQNFPALCRNLVSLNISANNFEGDITGCFDQCARLKYLDLSSNHFVGHVWQGFAGLREFSVSENNLTGEFGASAFPSSCDLKILDLSANKFWGVFPSSIANCSKLTSLNLWGNEFDGPAPSGIGFLSELEVLNLGKNHFDSDIPEELLNCSKLVFLDFSKCNFDGDIQEIFGRFKTVNYLILEGNSYTGGIESSGILALPNLYRLDLSSNLFSGRIPVAITAMPQVKILILANNSFSGNIPPELGRMTQLQLLDLSYNNLTGEIPWAIGNLTSLLWLMLANNSLGGVIPPAIGNCKSLLWLNLANNRLSGSIPPEITAIGSDPFSTFDSNRREMTRAIAGSGECLAMKRWIPASYPPFSFVYTLMTRSSCRTIWDRLLKGYGIFPICANSSSRYQSFVISGYLQLSGNQLSGVIPPEIGKMTNISLIHLDANNLSGQLPHEISELPLVVLNISDNLLSGEIPSEIGSLQCLSSLDLSRNNLSGKLPESLNGLSDLNKFNVSYNPLLSGEIPISGQLITFGHDPFIGDPLISFAASSARGTPPSTSRGIAHGSGRHRRVVAFWVFLAFCSVFLAGGAFILAICILGGRSVAVDPYADSEELDPEGVLLDGIKRRSDAAGSSSTTTVSSSLAASSCSAVDGAVSVFTLERGARECAFTYNDIVAATRNFDEQMVVGRGGHGVVYRAVLPGGRQVAVKKLQRHGREEEEDKGEREFKAEMEVMAGSGHPNLVALHGWCLTGTARLLVYEYMEGGTLDEVIEDWESFGWERRLAAATGVARALAFLHHDCTPAVVHRDVKASNVLLDGQGNARVTDFGLARAVAAGNSHVSTVVAGTVGYVAPEYGHTWRATTRGDVYSYGVLAMELATGRRALDGGDECLVERVRRSAAAAATKEELGLQMVGVREGEGSRAMLGLLKVGFGCAAEAPQMRPNMREVVEMLLSVAEKSDDGSESRSNGEASSSSSSASPGRSNSDSDRFFASSAR